MDSNFLQISHIPIGGRGSRKLIRFKAKYKSKLHFGRGEQQGHVARHVEQMVWIWPGHSLICMGAMAWDGMDPNYKVCCLDSK